MTVMLTFIIHRGYNGDRFKYMKKRSNNNPSPTKVVLLKTSPLDK